MKMTREKSVRKLYRVIIKFRSIILFYLWSTWKCQSIQVCRLILYTLIAGNITMTSSWTGNLGLGEGDETDNRVQHLSKRAPNILKETARARSCTSLRQPPPTIDVVVSEIKTDSLKKKKKLMRFNTFSTPIQIYSTCKIKYSTKTKSFRINRCTRKHRIFATKV